LPSLGFAGLIEAMQLLTAQQVAERFKCTAKTVKRNYKRWGLRPIMITGRQLFPLDQIEDLERRAIEGKITSTRGTKK
jgi:hypothetical protein